MDPAYSKISLTTRTHKLGYTMVWCALSRKKPKPAKSGGRTARVVGIDEIKATIRMYKTTSSTV